MDVSAGKGKQRNAPRSGADVQHAQHVQKVLEYVVALWTRVPGAIVNHDQHVPGDQVKPACPECSRYCWSAWCKGPSSWWPECARGPTPCSGGSHQARSASAAVLHTAAARPGRCTCQIAHPCRLSCRLPVRRAESPRANKHAAVPRRTQSKLRATTAKSKDSEEHKTCMLQ